MTNEFGVTLNRNGYAPSLLQPDVDEDHPVCYLCDDYLPMEHLDRNEAFGGPFRQKSKRLGLWHWAHHCTCHQDGPQSFEKNREVALKVKRAAQRAAMEAYGWSVEDFIREFGKNYL